MPKNQLTTIANKKQFMEITDIIKNQSARSKLQNYIDEVVICKTKILDQNESIKGLRDAAVDELGIHPKLFTSLVSIFFNNNFEDKLSEMEQLESAITALMQTTPIISNNIKEEIE